MLQSVPEQLTQASNLWPHSRTCNTWTSHFATGVSVWNCCGFFLISDNVPYQYIAQHNECLYIRVSDVGIRYLTEGSAAMKLKELNISHCSLITNTSVMRIAQRYIINFTYCYKHALPWSHGQLFCAVCVCVHNLSGAVNCTISTWVTVKGWLTRVWSGWVAALSAPLTSVAAEFRMRSVGLLFSLS